MSLSISPNLSLYSGIGALRQTDPVPDVTAAGPTSANEQGQQTGPTKVVGGISITSISININQTASTSSSDQLTTEVDKISRLANGDLVLQPLAEGYFSSPTNFVPTGSGATNGSPSETSDTSIALEILSMATTDASVHEGSQTTGKVDGATTPQGIAPDNSAYRPVDISI